MANRRALAKTMIPLATCVLVSGSASPCRGEDGDSGCTAAASAFVESGTEDWKTLELTTNVMRSRSLCGPGIPKPPAAAAAPEMSLPEQALRPGEATVVVRFDLPAGYEINADAPSRVTVSSEGVVSVPASQRSQRLVAGSREPRVSLEVTVGEGRGSVQVGASVYYCRKGKQALCHLVRPAWTVPVRSAPDGLTTITIDYRVTPPTLDRAGGKSDV